jgi:hypothetical protein
MRYSAGRRIANHGGCHIEFPTFRFSGRAFPKLAHDVRASGAVVGRRCLALVVAVAVTVAVSSAQVV